DGLVQMVVDAVPPAELGLGDQPLKRVSIFLSVFDVHINRTPCAGTVDVVSYRPGKYLNAAADKASEDNERMAIALKRADGRTIGCVQIAGWVARRIVCYIKPGQTVQAGERFGHIRFGSRTDLYLPPGARLLVATGQRMIGGETVMAELDPVKTEPRRGVGFWDNRSEEQVAGDRQRLSPPPRPVARLLDQPADPQRADVGGAVRRPDGD